MKAQLNPTKKANMCLRAHVQVKLKLKLQFNW